VPAYKSLSSSWLVFACLVSLRSLPLCAQPQSSTQPGPSIQVTTDALLIPAIVRDAQGKVITDLTQSDFKVYDQGKEQPLTGFSILQSNAQSTPASASATATAPAPASSSAATPGPYHFTILLFDDRHLSSADLEHAKTAALALFDQPLDPADRVVILSFHGVNSGVAKDPAVLKAAIEKLKSQDHSKAAEQDCPKIGYYEADQILNQHNQQAFNVAFADMDSCASLQRGTGSDPGWTAAQQRLVESAAMRSLQQGDADARETLAYIRDVIGSMSKLPGERTLVLISPGFFTSTTDAMDINSDIFSLATSFHVTISTLSVRGISGRTYQSDTHGSFAAAATGQDVQMIHESDRADQATLADFANGTGGTFFHNDNDLAGGFRKLAAKPECEYLLQISFKNIKRNGSYHKLEVKLDRPGLTIQARRGYYAPLPPKK
jgi:VWFA-related protein